MKYKNIKKGEDEEVTLNIPPFWGYVILVAIALLFNKTDILIPLISAGPFFR